MRWLLLLLLVSGCLPVPRTRTYVPRTVGTLSLGGAPVVGATVYRPMGSRSVEAPCRAPADSATVTTTEGGFDLPPISKRIVELFILGAESPPQAWTTCFVVGADTLASQTLVWPPRDEALLTCRADGADDERCSLEGWSSYAARWQSRNLRR